MPNLIGRCQNPWFFSSDLTKTKALVQVGNWHLCIRAWNHAQALFYFITFRVTRSLTELDGEHSFAPTVAMYWRIFRQTTPSFMQLDISFFLQFGFLNNDEEFSVKSYHHAIWQIFFVTLCMVWKRRIFCQITSSCNLTDFFWKLS